MRVIEEGEKFYKIMFNNLVNQYGAAESNLRAPFISPINGVQFGDSLDYTWKHPMVIAILYLLNTVFLNI